MNISSSIVPEKVFREYDIRGVVGKDISDEFVVELGKAIGTVFNNGDTLTVGYDARESSPEFCDLLCKGLINTGCNVVVIGMVPTPVLYYSLHTDNIAGGVMITGSHNPPEMNGFKICEGKFPLYGKDIQNIKEIMKYREYRISSHKGNIYQKEIVDEYIEKALNTLLEKKLNYKVAIDPGNGVGAITAVKLLESVGCEVIKLYCEPDGKFPNHHPDPVYEKNLVDLRKVVLENNCDIGFGFDGDADRIGVVSKTGRILYGDVSFLLLAKEVIERKGKGLFVSEVKASRNLYETINNIPGGNILMWKAGHSLIKAKMQEISADLGAEVSGHIFFFDRFFGFDDGPYAAVRMLEAIKRIGITPDELLDNLPETHIIEETRVDCPDEKKFILVENVKNECSNRGLKFNDIDGVRVELDRGWFLIRASNTQPSIVYRAEAKSESELKILIEMVHELLKKFGVKDV